jgi:hypothetical protein
MALAAGVALPLSLMISSAARAALTNSTWINGNGFWDTATDWNPPIVPSNNATDQFIVNINNGATVTENLVTTVNELLIDFFAPPSSTLAFANNAHLTIASGGLLFNGNLIATNAPVSGTLELRSGATGFNAGTLLASGGGTLTLFGVGTIDNTGGTIAAQAGSIVELGGPSGGALVVGGTLTTSGTGLIRDSGSGLTDLRGVTNAGLFQPSTGTLPTLFEGTVSNTGTIGVTGPGNGRIQLGIGPGTLLNNSGTLLASGGGTLSLSGVGTINNTGTIRSDGGSLVNLSQSGFTNFDPATGTLNGGAYLVTGTLQFNDANIVNNAATIVLNGSSAAGNITDQLNQDGLRNFASNSGTLILEGGKTLMTPNNFTNTGILNISSDSNFGIQTHNYTQTAGAIIVDGSLAARSVNIQGGTVKGIGVIFATVVQNSGGIVAPGNSPGILLIDQSYAQTSGGTLDIQVGGLIAGTEYSQLDVFRNATLAGTLDIELINGFSPTADASFDILLAGLGGFGTVSGTFDTLEFPGLSTGTWNISYLSERVRVNFDFMGPPSSVPEPPSALLLAVALAGLGLMHRWRQCERQGSAN